MRRGAGHHSGDHSDEECLVSALAALVLAAVTHCTASDGDTIRCGSERIRLLGIDAPEMPGHCRKGRQCAPGNPRAAKAGLARAISQAPIRIDWITVDRYGRTIAVVDRKSTRLNSSP